ncbi:hypothetical protein [Oceanibium sediminis]|uniref:hypothetical protein n=1 Tax=Oceanibium sediminis TaxID=2026339 RepID=UPI001E4A7DCE|nr:hypothetical protein [Oceanibium sediminis]
MKHRIAAPLFAAALLAGASASPAATCGTRAEVVDRLRTDYGETRTGAGLSGADGVIEVFASEESGTWTILLTRPNGQSCLLAAGESWMQGPVPGPGLMARSGQPG